MLDVDAQGHSEEALQAAMDSNPHTELVFKIFQHYVESAEKISSRRQAANSFYLSINTAVVAANGYFRAADDTAGMHFYIAAMAIAGATICYLWSRQVRSYRNLNSAKFKVIHKLESQLPFQPYAEEWNAIGRGERPDLYLPFTAIEQRVPWVFLVLHLALLAAALLGIFD